MVFGVQGLVIQRRKKAAQCRKLRKKIFVAAAAILITQLGEDEDRKYARRMWEHKIVQKRAEFREFSHLYWELRQDNERFFTYFRMSVEQFDFLLAKVHPLLVKNSIRPALTPAEHLVITLRYFASGSDQKSLSETFRVGKSTVCMVLRETADVIWKCLGEEYLPFPQSPEDWQKIAEQFWEKWDMPNCLGAIDGKHIAIKNPKFSGSTFFNYKHFFSIVLLAVSDADNLLIYFDIGTAGRACDGGLFATSELGKAVVHNALNVPRMAVLPGSDIQMPLFFVCDEAFPLRENMMRPYPGRNKEILERYKQIFNYRLSRARRVVESTFGIIANRWRILLGRIEACPESVEKYVRAICVLHTFLKLTAGNSGEPGTANDRLAAFEERNAEISVRDWRKNPTAGSILSAGSSTPSNRPTRAAIRQRDVLAHYFMNEGAVDFQDEHIPG